MKTRAAVMRSVGQDWEVTELELDPPKGGEVLVRYVASGLCFSDEHVRNGGLLPRFPIVGGHEGAGIVEEVGEVSQHWVEQDWRAEGVDRPGERRGAAVDYHGHTPFLAP